MTSEPRARLFRVLICGAGGHGKVVAEVVRAAGHDLVGFADARSELIGGPVPGVDARVVAHDRDVAADAAGVLARLGADALAWGIGRNGIRLERHCAVSSLAPVLVHPRAIVPAAIAIGSGSIVMPGVIINPAVVIGEAVILNTGCIVEHDCVVGDGAHVAPGAVLTGGVSVGREAWVGAGAVVLPGLSIGGGAIVGAGAVVTRDVEPGVTVVGNPARQASPIS